MRGSATALVGAQYGSEGKGAVAAAIAGRYDAHVRTGGPNAGHTFYHLGRKWVARSLPCGWVNPDASLFIGPGAVLDLDLLLEEAQEVEDSGYSVADRLYVDPRAVCITDVQRMGEGGVNGYAHENIGSTGEGVGLARMSKIGRDSLVSPGAAPYRCSLVSDWKAHNRERLEGAGAHVIDVPYELEARLALGGRALLEGTQGSGLSLTHGPWPYCTSADTNAAQLLADAGVSPGWYSGSILVARTFPIRVAGNSGPLKSETTWEEIGVEPETTTVTKKVRRVADWDSEVVLRAITLNSPAQLVVTFLDYLFPVASVSKWEDLPLAAVGWLEGLERELGVSVIGCGTGPETIAWRPS